MSHPIVLYHLFHFKVVLFCMVKNYNCIVHSNNTLRNRDKNNSISCQSEILATNSHASFMGVIFSKTGLGLCRGIKLLYELKTMLDPSKVKILNDEEEKNCLEEGRISDPNEVVELSKQLHRQVLKLKGEYLQDDGTVKYASLRESEDFRKFKKECGRLRAIDLFCMKEMETKAFFLNVYNTLTVHALAETVNEEKTVLQLERFWQMYGYKIGDFVFSLDDMEHGVLRCNQIHPTNKKYFFKEGDPRRAFVLTTLDPRVHFALNCGAKSCPPIRLFSAENLDTALDMAAKNFCQNDVIIDAEKKQITATKILMWYGSDFGPDEKAVVARITPYLNETQQIALEKIEDDFKLTFSDYDWSIH